MIAIFASSTLYAQTGSSATKVDSANFSSLTDSLIKREVAFFTVKGSSFKETDLLNKTQLSEIPVRNCTDKEVHLSWSTFTSAVSTFIDIYFKGENSNRTLDSIFLVTHSHFWVKFPNTAFQGLPQLNSCNYTGNGKNAEFFSPHYKAFYSADKRRLYIYMQGGTDSRKYEVTWIIVGDKYFTRIVDSIL
ncbi:MAG TPA: hypothetical protein VK589_03000 [Chryseolinea sp.]|nr:hypothetical protein [Chryseolinea sp.]